jgi:hypothetical protein
MHVRDSQVDDEIDEDIMAVLLEPALPGGFRMCNTEEPPGQVVLHSNVQLLTAIRRVEWSLDSKRLNQQFATIFHSLYSSIMFKVTNHLLRCCWICCLTDFFYLGAMAHPVQHLLFECGCAASRRRRK